MMKNFSICLIIFFSILINIYAQDDKDFPALSEAELTGVKILQSKYFDGNGLWGHIDGGADLYLEYGFDKLLFQEVGWNKNKFRVEFYRMNDAAAAFGIFSVSRFKCDVNDTLTKFICITKYQVQSALGKFYISISNDKGTDEAKNLTLEIFNTILRKSNAPVLDLSEPFSKEYLNKYSNEIKFFRGVLGIQNGLPAWIDLFENYSGYEITVLPYENKDGYLNFARVKFASGEDKIKFMSTVGVTGTKEKGRLINKINGIAYIAKTISENEIYFYETVFNNEEINKILGE